MTVVTIGENIPHDMSGFYSIMLPKRPKAEFENLVTLTLNSGSTFKAVHVYPIQAADTKVEVVSARIVDSILTIQAKWATDFGSLIQVSVLDINDEANMEKPVVISQTGCNVNINVEKFPGMERLCAIILPDHSDMEKEEAYSKVGTFSIDSCGKYKALQVLTDKSSTGIKIFSALLANGIITIKAAWAGDENVIEILGLKV